ncbi:tripartite tricarboxylate transporter TctB family protein [Caldovatus aquaticus]|uniref:Tripartite tricarboxylate transporter TctB family protein n=1 Tax=Caldovatus aquaticus TaxID=2865671 RepID=A0ABS7EYM2_9PROT|nr:tripartite tricarboxylate transporter TctB family protein [Caldovatus aquaticus]MBW8268467.1 tripartite tricarboxylate transporter TctB family protein [Caldovatus aquaticus]
MHLPDRVSGAILAGLGALAAYGGSRLPPVPGQDVGPNVFPMVVGAGLILCGVLIAFGIGRSFEAPEEDPGAAVPAAGSLAARLVGLRALLPPALLLLYVLVVERLGFLPTAAVLVLVTALALGARLRLALPLAAAAPLAVHAVFSKLLRVPLPDGMLPAPW